MIQSLNSQAGRRSTQLKGYDYSQAGELHQLLRIYTLLLAALASFHCGYTKLAASKFAEPLGPYTVWVGPAERPIVEYPDTADIGCDFVVIGPVAAAANRVSESEAVRNALHIAQVQGADAISNLQFSIKSERYADVEDVDVTHVEGLLIKFSDNIIPVGDTTLTFELPTALNHRVVVRSLAGEIVKKEDYRPGNSFVFDPAGLEEGVYGVYTWSGDVERSPFSQSRSYHTYFETTTWVVVE